MDYGRRCDDLAQSGPPTIAASARKGNVRKFSQRLLAAVHYACDLGEYETARMLLAITEDVVMRRDALYSFNRRRIMDDVVLAYERLWSLRQPWQEAGLAPSGRAFEAIRDMLGRGDASPE